MIRIVFFDDENEDKVVNSLTHDPEFLISELLATANRIAETHNRMDYLEQECLSFAKNGIFHKFSPQDS